MNEATTAEPKVTTFRLDADVAELLAEFCRMTRRSKNNAVNFLLAAALSSDDDRPESWPIPNLNRSAK